MYALNESNRLHRNWNQPIDGRMCVLVDLQLLDLQGSLQDSSQGMMVDQNKLNLIFSHYQNNNFINDQLRLQNLVNTRFMNSLLSLSEFFDTPDKLNKLTLIISNNSNTFPKFAFDVNHELYHCPDNSGLYYSLNTYSRLFCRRKIQIISTGFVNLYELRRASTRGTLASSLT